MTKTPRETLPRDVRITKRRDYLHVYRTGFRFAGPLLVLFIHPRVDDETGHARIGITATKKIGNAVVRNRMRRLVRESFRRHRHQIGPWDIVVNVRLGAHERPGRAVQAEFVRLVERAQRRMAKTKRSPKRPGHQT